MFWILIGKERRNWSKNRAKKTKANKDVDGLRQNNKIWEIVIENLCWSKEHEGISILSISFVWTAIRSKSSMSWWDDSPFSFLIVMIYLILLQQCRQMLFFSKQFSKTCFDQYLQIKISSTTAGYQVIWIVNFKPGLCDYNGGYFWVQQILSYIILSFNNENNLSFERLKINFCD